jgi:hypothetical protein
VMEATPWERIGIQQLFSLLEAARRRAARRIGPRSNGDGWAGPFRLGTRVENLRRWKCQMTGIFTIVGVGVVVLFVMGYFGLR